MLTGKERDYEKLEERLRSVNEERTGLLAK